MLSHHFLWKGLRLTGFTAKKMLMTSHTIGDAYDRPIQMSTGQLLLQITEKSPDAIALNCFQQSRQFTYQELTMIAIKLAQSLHQDFAIKPKDRIAVYSFNKWEWYVVQLAAALSDAILVNINPSYKVEELTYTLEKVGVKVLFISDSFKHSNYLKIVQDTVPEITSPHVHPFRLNSGKFPSLTSVVRMIPESDKSQVPGFVNFLDLLHRPATLNQVQKTWPSNSDPANIQFTSGTTGLPKAATLSHFNILNNGFAVGKRLRLTNKDNICVPVPLYHCFGMILGNLAALTRGAQLTYVCEGFDPLQTLQAISNYKCTTLYGVPTMFSEYLRVYEAAPSKYEIGQLRTGIIAGSLAPEKLMKQILAVLQIKDITNCYGMTETSPVSFQTSPTDTLHHKTTTVGSILDGLEAKIVNEKGQTCEVGQPGEFVVRGWAVMKGYWEDPQANEEAIVNGWMHSGDIGTLDQQGYLSIVGRIKDMIIRGGENISPKEIEEFLNRKLPDAIDVQVVGVTDEKFGEEIVALIQVTDLQTNLITKEEVYGLCKNAISHYKIPKYVKFVTQLPLTVTGKPQKYIMRQMVEAEKNDNQLDMYKIR